MSEPTIQEVIRDNALGPAEVSTQAGRVKARSMDELAKAQELLDGSTAADRNHLGIRFRKLVRPGAS